MLMDKCFCFIDFMPLFVVLVFVFMCEQLTEVVPSELLTSDSIGYEISSVDSELPLYCEDVKNINAIDAKGNNALIYASFANSAICVDYLIKKKADINHINQDGETALLVACRENGFCSSACLLVNAGADIKIKDSFGNSVWKSALLGERYFWAQFLDKFSEYDYSVKYNFLKDFYIKLEYYILGGTCCPYHHYRKYFPFEEYF